jgi:hypothetical protein
MSSASLMEVAVEEFSDTNNEKNVQWFDLKLDRNLLDASFEGYKLSLDPFVKYNLKAEKELKLDTYNYVESGESRNRVFLYQHLKLYGLQNLLYVNFKNHYLFNINYSFFSSRFVNHFEDSNLYYFDVTSRLVKIIYNKPKILPVRSLVATNIKLNDVQDISNNTERVNPTLKFINQNLCFIFNGLDSLLIYEIDNTIKTEDPLITENWKLLHKQQVDSNCFSSIIRDGVQFENNYHVLLMNVQESQETSSQYDTLAHWLTFENNNNTWCLKRTRIINCYNSVPDYISLETNGKSVYLTGPSVIKYVYDSLIPVKQEIKQEINMNIVTELTTEKTEKFYSWNQSSEEVNLNVRLDDSTKIYNHQIDAQLNKNDIKVDLKFNSIQIFYKEISILNGHLYSSIKPDESIWTLNTNNKMIEVSLIKSKFQEVWTSFLKDNDLHGDYQSDQPMDQETNAFLNNLTSDTLAKATESKNLFTLEQQLEECDGIVDDQMMANCDNNDDKLVMLRRIDGDSHKDTHKCFINDNKYLFDVKVSSSKSPALVMRHDVDGILFFLFIKIYIQILIF